MPTPERRAYREAWHVRKSTGDSSRDVLQRALHSHNVDSTFTEPGTELHAWLFELWDQGVSPAALGWEATKEVGRRLPHTVRSLAAAARAIRRNLQ